MSKATLNLTLGCDPEVLVRDRELGIIPICGLIGAGKDNPLKIADGVSVQEDGVSLEFNIDPIDYIKDDNNLYGFAQNATSVIENWLYGENPKTKGKNLSIESRYSEWTFKAEQLTDPKANTFGCDPDCDAWKGGAERAVFNSDEFGRNRFCGGHIHLGYDTSKVEIPKWALVQLIDGLAEAPLYYAGQQPGGAIRSKFYGMPGIFREKPYGIEYRTPSNAWVFGRSSLAKRVANVVMWAINNQAQARDIFDKMDRTVAQHIKRAGPGDRAVDAINNSMYEEIVYKYVRSINGLDEDGFPIGDGQPVAEENIAIPRAPRDLEQRHRLDVQAFAQAAGLGGGLLQNRNRNVFGQAVVGPPR